MLDHSFNKFWLKLSLILPKNLDELNPAQFKSVTRILFSKSEFNHTNKLRLIDAFFKPRLSYFLTWLKLGTLTSSQIFELTSFTDFIYHDKLKSDLNFLPYFRIKGRKYIGSFHRYSYLTFGQFCMASDYISLFNKDTSKIELLDKFIVILYKPANAKEDDHSVLKRASSIKSLNIVTKYTIYHNFMLFMSYLVQHPKLDYVFIRQKAKGTKTPVKKKITLWLEVVDEWVNHQPEKHEEKYALNVMQVLFSLGKINEKNQKNGNNKTK